MPCPPAAEIHRHVDGDEEGEEAGDADDAGDQRPAHRSLEFRHEAAQRDAGEEKRHRPQRILDRVVEEIRRDDRVPGEALRDDDDGHDHQRDVHRGLRPRHVTQLMQDDRPLRHEAQLGHGRDGAADEDAGEPGVEQADALHVGARQERSERAAEHIAGAEQEHQPDIRTAAGAAGNRRIELAVQHEPDEDVGTAYKRQGAPPPREGI
jgi:hypothetical protein